MFGFEEDLLARSRTPLAKILVCALIGGFVGLLGIAEAKGAWPCFVLGGAIMGGIAGAILILRDSLRRRRASWKAEIRTETWRVVQDGRAPDLEEAHRIATETAEQRDRGCIFWFGMILGGLVGLSGLIMTVVRVVQFFRS